MTQSTALHLLRSAQAAGHIKNFTMTITEAGQTVYYFTKADGSTDFLTTIS